MVADRLLVASGSLAGEEIELEDELVLGRDQGGRGDLGGDEELSRRHARIRRGEDGRLRIEDLGSTNGTFVNDSGISAETTLAPGDQVRLGTTNLTVEAGAAEPSGGTVIAGRPPPVAAPAPPPPPAAAAPPPPPPAAAPAQAAGAAGSPGDSDGRAKEGRSALRRSLLVGGIGGLIAAGVIVVLIVVSGGDDGKEAPKGGGATAVEDCGASLPDGVEYIAYVESNVAEADANSVMILPYGEGDLEPLTPSQCATGGSGSTDLTDSGVLDADNQVILNPRHNLLFAVNQGSDSIAVFQVASDGSLTPAPGSPYPSEGKAPASLGLSGTTLVVANKAQDGVRELSDITPNYTTFNVARDGSLTPVEGSTVEAEPGSSPTDAFVPADGGTAFSTEESGPMRGFSIGADGVLELGPNSPIEPDPAIFGPGFDPEKIFALGIDALPADHLLFIGMPTVPALAVYSYDAEGRLTYLNSVPVNGTYLPCWVQITPDEHWLYLANADTNNVAAFDISDPVHPRQIQVLGFETPGNPWNEEVDPTGRYLFVNTPRDTEKVPAGEGNTQHVMEIGSDGKLTELPISPVDLPVEEGVNPQGLAILKTVELRETGQG